MKSFKLLISIIISAIFSVNINAQSHKIAQTLDNFESNDNTVGMDMHLYGDVTVDGKKYYMSCQI